MTTPARTLPRTASGVPPALLSEEEFPADTTITLTDNLNSAVSSKRMLTAELWVYRQDALILIQDVPSGACARVVGDDEPFESLLYCKMARGQWSLLGAELKDESAYVSVLVQKVYNAQPRPDSRRVEVNYHAIRLAHVLKHEAEVRNPLEPAAPAIDNEKLSIRYGFQDLPLSEPQVRMRPASQTEARKTRTELAHMIANDLRTKLQKTGNTLHHNREPVNFDDIVLLSVAFNSQGTMQPRLAVVSKCSNVWDDVKHILSSL